MICHIQSVLLYAVLAMLMVPNMEAEQSDGISGKSMNLLKKRWENGPGNTTELKESIGTSRQARDYSGGGGTGGGQKQQQTQQQSGGYGGGTSFGNNPATAHLNPQYAVPPIVMAASSYGSGGGGYASSSGGGYGGGGGGGYGGGGGGGWGMDYDNDDDGGGGDLKSLVGLLGLSGLKGLKGLKGVKALKAAKGLGLLTLLPFAPLLLPLLLLALFLPLLLLLFLPIPVITLPGGRRKRDLRSQKTLLQETIEDIMNRIPKDFQSLRWNEVDQCLDKFICDTSVMVSRHAPSLVDPATWLLRSIWPNALHSKIKVFTKVAQLRGHRVQDTVCFTNFKCKVRKLENLFQSLVLDQTYKLHGKLMKKIKPGQVNPVNIIKALLT